jgi:hypothetical protein
MLRASTRQYKGNITLYIGQIILAELGRAWQSLWGPDTFLGLGSGHVDGLTLSGNQLYYYEYTRHLHQVRL